MEKFLEYLQEAEKIITAIDHIAYITFTLIKDKRLLIKIITETKTAITDCINAILQYEYINKRISLSKNANENFEIFIKNCAPRYKITKEEISSIIELFDIVEEHKKSPIEIMKEGKIIIMSDNFKRKTISFEKIKEFLFLAKNIFKKTKETFLK
jgi:hypothetical protein